MNLRMVISLLLSSFSDHNDNAVVRLYGPQAMFTQDLLLPSAPPNAKRETNLETLRRLSRDLALINEGELIALDAYGLVRKTEDGKSSWGYCCEAAREEDTNEIFVLIRTDETDTVERALYWVPLSQLQTRKHAQLFCDIAYEGPTKDAGDPIFDT